MSDKTRPAYWFPAKPPGHGWGWGLPLTWQGWVVFVGFFVLLVAGAVLILPHGAWYFEAWVFGLAALLILICVWKGEPPGGAGPGPGR
ncbi:alkaline shock response membrane anchor protein AmaP [Massilia oculi]|uniref:Alkaline shock response membrane anchor protein AmaP n=1 Tax=Massilia hydrophila TaxID=3044279 RepID=A0ABS7YBK1_9BURK|nr:alkaline shock response membrane anchor protein AmaP [Massilia oculi]MCA1857071.1 alkaline shock response membrane anchor protein AmaP [Massilia oculi]